MNRLLAAARETKRLFPQADMKNVVAKVVAKGSELLQCTLKEALHLFANDSVGKRWAARNGEEYISPNIDDKTKTSAVAKLTGAAINTNPVIRAAIEAFIIACQER